jgi:ribose transport system permease protein
VPALFVVIFIVFSIATPSTFATLANVRVIINGQATILLLALAILIPLRSGDFDLSVSSVMVLVGCTVASLTAHGVSTITACVLAVLIGPVVGAINGILVVRVGVNSFIATLGTLTVLDGLSALISHSALMTTIPKGLTQLMGRSVAGLTLPVLLGWVVAIIAYYVFEWTPIGRYMLFIGNNITAARLAGLRVSAYRQGTYLVSGTLAAIAGLLLAGSLGSVDPAASAAYLLPPVTAAFLGASAIRLGRFNVAGTLVAIYLVAEGVQGLELLGLSGWVADVFNGTFLIFAVSLAIFLRRKSSK